MKQLTQSQAWQVLQQHHHDIAPQHMREWFVHDKHRFANLSMHTNEILVDFSKQRVTPTTIQLLCELANQSYLYQRIEDMFAGESVNNTEKRAALHTALRNRSADQILVNGQDVMPDILASLDKLRHFTTQLHQQRWHGHTGLAITDVVNIGIGGSDLGPRMVTAALTSFRQPGIRCHFVANVDGTELTETLKPLNPATTLFVIASKTFTTLETLINAASAKRWLVNGLGNDRAIAKHFVAITANDVKALEFGIDDNNIFKFWDWVGGRFSLWSAIGLTIAISIGMDAFEHLLAGAYTMDKHFCSHDYRHNIPIVMALIDIWNINFFNWHSHAIIPYDHYLRWLPAYLQQAEMESNGKSMQRSGQAVNYATAPVIWGQPGSNSQHAFLQALLQGTQTVPVDFIVPLKSHNPLEQHHELLFASCLSQSNALMSGRTLKEATHELIATGMPPDDVQALAPHKVIPGNRPSTTLLLESITPTSLGELIALYEHKIFATSVIWNINAFDQWGVELSKQLANKILPDLTNPDKVPQFDASTNGLIRYFHQQHITDHPTR